MKKFQKVLSVLLTAAMLLGLLSGLSVAYAATGATNGSCGTGVNYMYSNETLFIYGTGRMADYAMGEAPWTSYAGNIKKLEIQSGVQYIGMSAFANFTACSTYVIPSTVTEIGSYAFLSNTAMVTISLPGVALIKSGAFLGCSSLHSASYPTSVVIESGNDSLKNVGSSAGSAPTIPSDNMLITSGTDGDIIWKLYSEGTLAILPKNSGQQTYMPVYSNVTAPWAHYNYAIDTIVIADGIQSIGEYAFSNMTYVTSVVIGQNTTTIGACAFMGCSSLQKLEFSSSMRTIYDFAFYGCNALNQVVTSLNVNQISISNASGGNAPLISAMGTGSGSGSGVVTPPTTSTSGQIAGTTINWSISSGVLTLTSTTGNEAIPNYASTAAPWAAYATQITSIKLNGITQIGYCAFVGMTRLTMVDFGSAATEIQSYAFQGAVSLQALTLPGSLRTIQAYAFADASPIIATTPNPEVLMEISMLGNNLTMRYSYTAGTGGGTGSGTGSGGTVLPGVGDVTTSSPNGSCGSNAQYSYDSNTKKMVIYGSGPISAYGQAWEFPWYGFAGYIEEIEIRAGITAIPARAFYTTGALTKITIPSTVTTIGAYAFYLSNKLSAYDPQGASDLGPTIDNSPSGIQIDSQGNYNLTSGAKYTKSDAQTPSGGGTITNPNSGFISGTNISWTFDTYSGELLIRSTQSGGEDMPNFSDYNSNVGYSSNVAPWAELRGQIVKITMQGIKHIGEYAFSDMTKLTTVSFAGTTTSIGSFAFARDTAITHLTFPASLTLVQHSAFSQCSLSTIATTPLISNVTISVGANNNITFQYQVAGATNTKEGYILGTNIFWSFNTTTGVLTVESTNGTEDIPDMATGAAPWQEISAQVTAIKMRGIRTIGKNAFARMTSLTSVDFAAETTTIGESAFMKATSLRTLTLTPMISTIAAYAFEDCTISATTSKAQGTITIGAGNTGLQITYSQNSGISNGNNIQDSSIYWTFSNGVLTLQSLATNGEPLRDFTSSTSTPWYSYRTNITKVVLVGITRVGQYAFADLPYLMDVAYANNTAEVARYAFMNCSSLRNQTLPASLTTIYPYAYYNCSSLYTTTPNTQSQMNVSAEGNTGLIWTWGQSSGSGSGTGTQPSSNSGYITGTSIYWSFNSTTGVLTLSSSNASGEALPSAIEIDYAWETNAVMCKSVTKIVMQNITDIGLGVFLGMINLTDVSFGTMARSIDRSAFAQANSLRELTIPASLTNIHASAFMQCANTIIINTPNSEAQMVNASSVMGVTFRYGQANPNPDNPNPNPNPDTPVTGATSGTVAGTTISWTYYSGTQQLTLSSSTGAALPAFDSASATPWAHLATSITSIRLLNITAIGKYAFAGLNRVSTIVFSDNLLTTIDAYAFQNATALTSITLGSAVTEIKANAFAGCSLTVVTPNYQKNVNFSQEGNAGVTWTYAVYDYSSLSKIPNTDLEWRIKDGVLYFYGNGAIPNFTAEDPAPWADAAEEISKIAFYGEITGIGAYAFAGLTGLTNVSLPATVTTIGASAFEGCAALKTMSFPAALTTIGANAFADCAQLQALELSAALTEIGSKAFYNCAAITEVAFMSTANLAIGSSAFEGCTALAKAIRQNDIKLTLAAGNDLLDKALRPASASGITAEGITWNADCVNGMLTLSGSGAITDSSDWKQYLPYIQAVMINGGITEIGEALFENATALETIILPATLTKIGAKAFAGCTALNKVTIPASVTEIGSRAFYGCAALTEIALPLSVTVLPEEVFANCSSLKTVTTSYLLTTIGQGAFKNCTALEKFTIPATVTALGSEAFNGCSALTTLVVAKGGLAAISGNTFSGCGALSTVYFAGSASEWAQMTANADAVLKNAAYNKAITLTIEYYFKNTQTAAPTVVIVGAPGDVANVTSPVLENYSTRDEVVSTTLSADATVTVVYDPDRYSLVIQYVDAEGNEMASPALQFLYYGEAFKRADVILEIEGYAADMSEIDLGVVTGPVDPITVTYTPREYTVHVVQVDQDGKLLSDKVYTFSGLFGTNVEIDLAQLDEIAHYELGDENVYVIEAIKADITAEAPYQIVYQKKAYDLTIEFKDMDGFMVAPSKTITVFFGEPVNYEVPSLEDKGYMPVDTTLVLEAYNGEETLVARYKLKTFSVELQFVEVNSDGHKMLDSETVEIVYGTNFIYEIPAITGYVASQTKIDLGLVTAQPEGPIIIEYTPDVYDLTIQLFDREGKTLGTQVVENIQVGSTYKIALNPVEGYLTDGIVIEGIMGPGETNKIISVVLEQKPASEPNTEHDPNEGEDDPKPPVGTDDSTMEMVIVILLIVVVLGLGAIIFYVSYLKKRN